MENITIDANGKQVIPPMQELKRQMFNNSKLLQIAAQKYVKLSATQSMTRPDGLIKPLQFQVTMINSQDQTFKVAASYQLWSNKIKVHHDEIIEMTTEQIDAIQTPSVAQQ